MNFKYKNLKTGVLKTMCVCAALVLTNCNTDETQEVTQLTNLVMQDEFDIEGTPDPSLWSFDIGNGPNNDGWGNAELQYYTDRTENVSVENGLLVITAHEESFEGSNFTSGRLTSLGLFEQQYGRFEARIQMPYGKGLWPAFWLLGSDCNQNPWPQCGEIDIVEFLGNKPTEVSSSVHGPGYCGNAFVCEEEPITKTYTIENDRFDTGFHVFGIEWGPSYINYYVDGDLYHRITPETVSEETEDEGEWVFNRPFHIIINMAVGGGLPGAPNDETVFPQRMYVDYVRVYN